MVYHILDPYSSPALIDSDDWALYRVERRCMAGEVGIAKLILYLSSLGEPTATQDALLNYHPFHQRN